MRTWTFGEGRDADDKRTKWRMKTRVKTRQVTWRWRTSSLEMTGKRRIPWTFLGIGRQVRIEKCTRKLTGCAVELFWHCGELHLGRYECLALGLRKYRITPRLFLITH